MQVAINRLFDHEGTVYHLHCEDLGLGERSYEVRVIVDGGVIWQRRIGYGELASRSSGPALEQELHREMERTVQTVQAAIVRGRISG